MLGEKFFKIGPAVSLYPSLCLSVSRLGTGTVRKQTVAELFMYMFMNECLYANTYVCRYVCGYSCMYDCIFVYMCVYMYACTVTDWLEH